MTKQQMSSNSSPPPHTCWWWGQSATPISKVELLIHFTIVTTTGRINLATCNFALSVKNGQKGNLMSYCGIRKSSVNGTSITGHNLDRPICTLDRLHKPIYVLWWPRNIMTTQQKQTKLKTARIGQNFLCSLFHPRFLSSFRDFCSHHMFYISFLVTCTTVFSTKESADWVQTSRICPHQYSKLRFCKWLPLFPIFFSFFSCILFWQQTANKPIPMNSTRRRHTHFQGSWSPSSMSHRNVRSDRRDQRRHNQPSWPHK